jgi:hypothetical protein
LPVQDGSTNAGPQLVTTPTAQAILIASPPHAAKTHVPPPAPPVADPPTEPDPEAEERQPAMKPTERQTPAEPSDEETPRPSCWHKAAESLQEVRPDVYKKLEQIKSQHENWSESDLAGLLKSAESRMREDKGIPRVIEQTIRSILQFKDIVAAAANFDPHKIAPVVWRGFCVVLQVSCYLSRPE